MAVAQHKPSRRALLGAAVALPLLGRAGAIAVAANPEPWRRALAAFEAAEAELRAFERQTAGAPWEEQEAIEEGYGDRLGAMYAALRRLLRLPAPDIPALATKIALAVDHEVGTLDGGEACLAALKRDARRLAGQA